MNLLDTSWLDGKLGVGDGYQASEFPEFVALCGKFDVDPHLVTEIRVGLDEVEVHLRGRDPGVRCPGHKHPLRVPYQTPEPPGRVYRPDITGWDLYRTEEFKNFCRRFGVVWGVPTIDLTIHTAEGAVCRVAHTYRCTDMGEA